MKYLHWQALSAVAIMGSFVGCNDNSDGRPAQSLINVVDESAGSECVAGGQRIETGLDSDRDGELDNEEIGKTAYACNGPAGTNGEDGEEGGSGEDGSLSVVDVLEEPAGANCADGGHKVSSGLDSNGNGELDADEVEKEFYVCQGADGQRSLIATNDEPAGENCADAGQVLTHGQDVDRDGVLDSDEIEGDTYLCNGAIGATGAISIAIVTNEPAGDNCAAGGKRVDTGVDADGNNALETAEIAQSSYVCNGVDGLASLVTMSSSAPPNCSAGGQRIDHGIDDDDDGILAEAEIDSTRYVCNGTDGSDGFSTLISYSAIVSGSTCTTGGQKLSMGLDNGDSAGTARNGSLEPGEVDSTANLCNGVDGADGLDGEDGVDGEGGVHLIDATGFDMGRMVGSSGFGGNLSLVSNTGYVYSVNYYSLAYYANTVYFAASECSGTAFTYSPVQSGNNNAIGGHFGVFIDTIGWFESVPNSYSLTRTFASYRSGAICYEYSGTTNGFTIVPSTAALVGAPPAQPATPATLR